MEETVRCKAVAKAQSQSTGHRWIMSCSQKLILKKREGKGKRKKTKNEVRKKKGRKRDWVKAIQVMEGWMDWLIDRLINGRFYRSVFLDFPLLFGKPTQLLKSKLKMAANIVWEWKLYDRAISCSRRELAVIYKSCIHIDSYHAGGKHCIYFIIRYGENKVVLVINFFSNTEINIRFSRYII